MARPAELRRLVSWTLVVTLCIAALTAIGAILSGGFDDTDAYVIATSIGFAVFTATAASGAALRYRASGSLRGVGVLTMGLSAASFVLLVVALWGEWDDEAWQWFGCVGLATLAGSHASLVSGARRSTDTAGIRTLATVSIVLALVDSLAGILAIAEVFEELDEQFGQLMAVLVVLMILTTALPPIIRRAQATAGPRETRPGGVVETRATLAHEVLAAADRIEALNADPSRRAPEIRRECEHLRELARTYER